MLCSCGIGFSLLFEASGVPRDKEMLEMAPKRTTGRAKAGKKTAKKPAAKTRLRARRAPRPTLETQHARVTAGRSHARHAMGMVHKTKTKHAGNTDHFHVHYLARLGRKGKNLAQAILQSCERDYAALQQIFGGITPKRLPFVIQITSGSTGASHSTCMSTGIAVGANSGRKVDFIRSLMVMEADEVFMANFGRGWNCGRSPGEGLSRVLANDLYRGVESPDFISSNDWLNLKRRPNFVDRADHTDTSYKSIGCSVLFLNWLRFQLNYSWAEIVAGGGATLAGTYKSLTGKSTGWSNFATFLDAHFPVGKKYRLRTDNPFPL
jgi:hypothetical protein